MKKINVNEIAALNGTELLEIRLKNGRTMNGFVSTTRTSHSSFFSKSNGILDYLILISELPTDNDKCQNNVFDYTILGTEIDEVFIISANQDLLPTT